MPSTVAPDDPIVEETNAVKKLLLISKPKITVIPAIIPTCVGINKAASAKGIGAKPSPTAAATAAATAALAAFFLILEKQFEHFVMCFVTH